METLVDTMTPDTVELVRSWKDPERRRDEALTSDHPAGEIALWSPGALSRRADLLADRDLQVTAWTIETMSIISTGFEEA